MSNNQVGMIESKEPTDRTPIPGSKCLTRRHRMVMAVFACLLVVGFLSGLWCYLRPDKWAYYTDEIAFRQIAKDVQPRPVVWEEASLCQGAANIPSSLSEPAISPDGSRMVFTRGRSDDNADLYLAKWDGLSWGKPQPLRALNSKFNEIGPAFSRDGQFLYFSTDRPGGLGGYDIWVSRWDGAEFAWPMPLTLMVNSRFDDLGPAPAPGGDKLYFSSNRPQRPLSDEEASLSDRELYERFKHLDHDLFEAHRIPAGVTNREVERATSMLYSLRAAALADATVMAKLGGTAESERAVDKAMAWLAAGQETHGVWSITRFGGQAGHDVASTAFALLTFAGRSELHDRPCKYRETVSRGLDWLLGQQDNLTGDLRGNKPAGNTMYDHAIAALALAEIYGLTKDENLQGPAQDAIDFLVDAQNSDDGGWRYTPNQPGDMSVSGWAIMALKSAEMSGLHVPEHTLQGVVKWLTSVSGGKAGGLYGYQGQGGKSRGGSEAMIATGYFCGQLMGLSPNTPKAFETTRHLTGKSVSIGDVYYAYYGTLCAYQNQGSFWRRWNGELHKALMEAQGKDGSWTSSGNHAKSMGRGIVTCLAALSLQAHYRYTPLYGLGYEPATNGVVVSTANLADLPEMPLYRRARRMHRVSSDRQDLHPAVTGHGDLLYFASDRAGGLGGFDIYRSRISGEEPSSPVNLGAAVNGPSDETAPAPRMGGFNLLFASNRKQTDDQQYQWHRSISRRVFRRHDYSQRPAIGWMVVMFPWRLSFILLSLSLFVVLILKRRRDSHRVEHDRVASRKGRPGGIGDWRRWVPITSCFVVMLGLMLSIFMALRATVWCYYTDDLSIRLDADEADVRLVLWEDPAPAVGSFNVATQAITARFLADGVSMVVEQTLPEATNATVSLSRWDGRGWSDPQPYAPPVNTTNTVRVPFRNGSYVYLSADEQGGLGGLDIYRARHLNGEELSKENLGAEINSPADDRLALTRWEGFDLLFDSNRGLADPGNSLLYSSTAREVVGRVDFSRWYQFTNVFNRVKWWILAGLAALALLVYLLRHWRNLDSLFHRCLVASVMVHSLIALLMSIWFISAEFLESTEPKTMEVAIDVDTLAKEKLALDMQEQVAELPASDVSVAIERPDALPMPEFTPPKPLEGAPIPTQTSDASFVTKVTPSKASENLAPSALAVAVAQIPEVEMPALEMPALAVELEEPVPTEQEKDLEPSDPREMDVEVKPLDVQQDVVIERMEPRQVETTPVSRPLEDTAELTNNLAAVVSTDPAGAATLDTDGSLVVPSAGMESLAALPELDGKGDIAALLITSPLDGKVLRMDAPGELDVPDSFGQDISPAVLENPGRLSTEVIEGLGGSAETQAAIARALDWFSKHQEPDGRWDIKKHGGEQGHDVAATSLILLCYYGWGAKHTEAGPHQDTVTKALSWLLNAMGKDDLGLPNGDYCTGHGSNGMYDQGMATIALCEAYGITKDQRLLVPATKAVQFIVDAQEKKSTGGWRYQPRSGADTSVFGWQYMALRSAELAGIPVPKETLDMADRWLDSVAGGKHAGIYGYDKPGDRGRPAMIATGMFSRQLAGLPPSNPKMLEGARYMRAHPIGAKGVDWYYLYYGTLALYQHQGETWEEWNTRMKETLTSLQHKTGGLTGSWDPSGQHGDRMGRAVVTAFGTLSLEVYYRKLPVYGFRPAANE